MDEILLYYSYKEYFLTAIAQKMSGKVSLPYRNYSLNNVAAAHYYTTSLRSLVNMHMLYMCRCHRCPQIYDNECVYHYKIHYLKYIFFANLLLFI